MDPNGAPLPQVPEVPITPVEAPIISPVAEATPQSIEQLPAAAPVVTERAFNIPQGAGPEMTVASASPEVSLPIIDAVSPPSVVPAVVEPVPHPEATVQPPHALEEAEAPNVLSVKDVQSLEQYRKSDELGQALEATLGSEVG